MDAPAAIDNIPYEILTKIILLVGTEGKRHSIFSSLTKTLRDVALNTPALWTNLTTTCKIRGPYSKTMIQPWYSEYLALWSERVKDRNDFHSHLKLTLSSRETGLGFLVGWFRLQQPTPWLYLECIVFTSCVWLLNRLDGTAGIDALLGPFNFPALRKYSVADAMPCPILSAHVGSQFHLVFPGLAPPNTRTGDCFRLSAMVNWLSENRICHYRI